MVHELGNPDGVNMVMKDESQANVDMMGDAIQE